MWSDGTTSNIKPISSSGTYVGFSYRDFCFATDTITISLIDCDTTIIDTTSKPIDSCGQKFLMPNVFSPNGDGNNDLFKPVYYDNYNLISLKIYNRWGNIVFEENPYNNSWNGINMNGKILSEGQYFYILKSVEEKIEINGSIMLVR